ncbi:tRNA1(Val) (adenine(37)-N6)-methyltransferase [Magnetospirillum sulfuroxidans]|uniref:tRNA1(Val) (adenine(37)-N6)-methyltransferase n=1 Tax=Magnetospirillum sulfuroxidans TaxID=611300 RepID=UPI00201117FE|nr:methyltransferase [Magnetospirillum sulfuroxidans]
MTLRQPHTGYRAGSDPVFLAAAVAAQAGDSVLDLGSGVGTAGLCLLARLSDVTVTGLELQPHLAALAGENAVANGLEQRYRVIEGCLTSRPAALRGAGFDHVITNPPWYEPGTIRPPQADSKAIGHLEGTADLAVWLKAAVKYLKPKGRLWLIHRADHLGRILAGLEKLPVGEIRILPLWPKRNRAAIRVLVAARKDSKALMEILPGLLVHDDDNAYTAAAEAVLRDGQPLSVA